MLQYKNFSLKKCLVSLLSLISFLALTSHVSIQLFRKIAKTSKTFLRSGRKSHTGKGKSTPRKDKYAVPPYNISDPAAVARLQHQPTSSSNRNSVLSTSVDSVTDVDSRPSSLMMEDDDELSSEYQRQAKPAKTRSKLNHCNSRLQPIQTQSH